MIGPMPTPLPAMAAPGCRAGALRLSLDGGDGAFDGMSHSGVLVVLQNRGRRACTVPGLPQIEALDAAGAALPLARENPFFGGGHGPVVVPVRLAPRKAASVALRWVAGPVYGDSRCMTPATLRVTAGGVVLKRPWVGGPICADGDKPATFTQPILSPGREVSGS